MTIAPKLLISTPQSLLLIGLKNDLVYIILFKQLTALVPSSHRRDEKKSVATGRQITDTLKERKCSRLEQSTLRIKNFKYGPSLSMFIQNLIMRQPLQISQFFTLVNYGTREFVSGLDHRGIEGQNNV